MNNFKEKFIKIPMDAIQCLTGTESDDYLNQAVLLPDHTYSMLTSPHTGAYIVGILKQYNLPTQKSSVISFLLLQIALGKKTLAQLPSSLSSELQVANDTAQKISQEIEKDLFAPIMLELNSYLAKKKNNSTSPTEGMGNVVNLKSAPKPPNKAFPLPPRQ